MLIGCGESVLFMDDDKKEKAVTQILESVSQEVEKNLLKYLSKDVADWIMADIDHVIFSHAKNDLMRVMEEGNDDSN